MDEEKHRITLGMKDSYFEGNDEIQAPSKQNSDDEVVGNDHIEFDRLTSLPESGSSGIQNLAIDFGNGEHPILADVEARASILPLEVPLDDIESSGMDDVLSHDKELVDSVDTEDEKSKRRAKKKANEER